MSTQPLTALCGHSPLFICSGCGRCPDDCYCQNIRATTLLSRESKEAWEVVRQLRFMEKERERKERVSTVEKLTAG